MEFLRQFLIWFLSALCVSAGAKLAHYLARLVTSYSQPEQTLPGSPSPVLCPQCGRALRRIRTSLVCLQCGYKEDPASGPASADSK